MKLTLEDRINDYKRMIKDFRLMYQYERCGKHAEYGFCNWLRYGNHGTIDDYPELLEQKPEEMDIGGYWWNICKTLQTPRVEALNNALKLAEAKL